MTPHTTPHRLAAQRGAATVAVTLMLSIAVLLGVVFSNRSVLFEAKTSTNQYRAAQAQEAAEAGVDWALAHLNSNAAMGEDCQTTSVPSAIPFRERSVATMHAACVANEGGWSCHCPASEAPAEPPDDSAIAFTIRLSTTELPGVLQLSSTGISRGASASRADRQVRLGRLPGLDAMPAAALTVRGAASFTSAEFELLHTNPDTGGITMLSAGPTRSPWPRLQSTPGTPSSASVLTNDTELAGLTPQGLFASMFRMDKTAWRTQPVVRELDCERACDAELAATASTHQLVWLRGGLRLESPISLGSPEKPVLLVVDGPVELHASAVIHGVLYVTDAGWVDTARADIHGAVVLESDLQAAGATRIHHDAAVLASLHEHTGTYARLSGSWLDH